MKHRSAHYWNWFIFFGLIAGLIYFVGSGFKSIDSESIWLLVTGLLGIILGGNWLNSGKLARPYDFLVGILFTLVGIIGILEAFHNSSFHIFTLPALTANPTLTNELFNSGHILGLSLATLPALVHAVLGLTSLNHAIKNE